jgi:3-oxoacyl-[acyl-carrier-protein] synthase III
VKVQAGKPKLAGELSDAIAFTYVHAHHVHSSCTSCTYIMHIMYIHLDSEKAIAGLIATIILRLVELKYYSGRNTSLDTG